MAVREHSTSLAASRRADTKRLAVSRLEAALTEQARLGDVLALSVGTSAEQSSHVRLAAASLQVSRCDLAVKGLATKTFAVAGGSRAPSHARDELRTHFGPKLDPAVMDLAELLLSELVTNCVIHGAAARPEARIEVAASLSPEDLWVEVSDDGPAFTHEPRRPSPDEGSGRGLYLVEQLAHRWGISEDGAARVWFEVARM